MQFLYTIKYESNVLTCEVADGSTRTKYPEHANDIQQKGQCQAEEVEVAAFAMKRLEFW